MEKSVKVSVEQAKWIVDNAREGRKGNYQVKLYDSNDTAYALKVDEVLQVASYKWFNRNSHAVFFLCDVMIEHLEDVASGLLMNCEMSREIYN